ncbi:MAG: hypothetical protein GYA35_04300, partial [Thermoanaerobaculaceae bacterium]|nr:hypothetical protein [Thermoanaerobaculaceae bacterium]
WVEYDPSRISRFFGGKDTIITNCNYYDKPIKSNVAEFEFIKPTGIDLEVYEKHHNSCNQITLTPEDLLQKYPTSTYAGYVLAEYPVELALQGYSCLDHSEECMRKWYDRGGGEESIKNRIKEAKEAMRKYNDYAKLFLELHPDFNLNGLIRKKYIMCLGFTGEEEEAQRQLEILAKGCGKEAEEAKNYLAKKSERRGGLEKKINGQTNTKE